MKLIVGQLLAFICLVSGVLVGGIRSVIGCVLLVVAFCFLAYTQDLYHGWGFLAHEEEHSVLVKAIYFFISFMFLAFIWYFGEVRL